jgi:hypothetical protein
MSIRTTITLPYTPYKHAGVVILASEPQELEALAERYGQPRFRAQQLLEAVLKGARSVEEIRLVCTTCEWLYEFVVYDKCTAGQPARAYPAKELPMRYAAPFK